MIIIITNNYWMTVHPYSFTTCKAINNRLKYEMAAKIIQVYFKVVGVKLLFYTFQI